MGFTYGGQTLDLFGGAKICQLDQACVVHQNVGTLDVAVHDAIPMQVLQPQQDLAGVDLDD